MSLVAGVDSSTQSTKVLLVESETGEIVDSGRASHPDGTECPPEAWWEALQEAGKGLLERAEAVAVAGQQHGMVALDANDRVVRPALLWNDTRSAPQAERLTAEHGGPEAWAADTGLVLAASFTATKLAWLAENEPANAAETVSVMLPHDWLTMKLRGTTAAEATTDRSDASGTGYWSPATGEYVTDRLVQAFGRTSRSRAWPPRTRSSAAPPGARPSRPAPATTPAPRSASASGPATSSSPSAPPAPSSASPTCPPPTPPGSWPGSPTPPAGSCRSCAPSTPPASSTRSVRSSVWTTPSSTRSRSPPSPAPEASPSCRTSTANAPPTGPGATGVLSGLTTGATRENLARAAVEGMLSAQADGLAALAAQGLDATRVLLIGGAAASEAVRRIAPTVFGVDVEVPPSAEYVALGAAKQAAWALTGAKNPPQWHTGDTARHTGTAAATVSEQYATLRDETAPWAAHR